MFTEPSSSVSDLTGPLLMRLLAGDASGVDRVLTLGYARGADTALIARDLITPALTEVGELWRQGQITIAEEHLATALVGRVLTRRSAALFAERPGAPRIVLTCLAGEFHELGIRISADVAQEAGWEAELLGSNVPRRDALHYIEQRTPEAVGLSVTLTAHIAECARTIDDIRRIAPRSKILVGGLAVRHDPDLGRASGADDVIQDAVGFKAWLLANLPKSPVAQPVPPASLPDAMRRRLARPRPGKTARPGR